MIVYSKSKYGHRNVSEKVLIRLISERKVYSVTINDQYGLPTVQWHFN